MKIIFFGMGSIGTRHYRLMKEMYPNNHYFAFRRNKTKQYTDGLRDIFDWEEIRKNVFDVAFICNPTAMHLETAIECAKLGINLLIEKPLSNSLDNVDELQRHVTTKKLKVLIGFNLRYHPVIEKIKELINNGQEKVRSFSAYCGSYLPDWRPTNYKEVYSASKKMGGGVVLDLIHELDYCTWIFGKPEKVGGLMGSYSSLDVEVEDLAEMILEYETGIGTIHLDYFRRVPRRTLEVVTENLVIEADLLQSTVSVTSIEKREEFHYPVDRDYTYRKQLKHFMKVLEGRELPRAPLQEAIEVLELALRFKREQE